MGDEFEERLREFSRTTNTAASSFSELAAVLGVSTERVREVSTTFTSNSAYQKYTPEQLVEKLVKSVKSSDLEGDELRALVGNVITSVTNQLYEIIKERES